MGGGDSTAVGDKPTLLLGSPFPAALGRGNLKLCFQRYKGEVSRASFVKWTLVCLIQQLWSLLPRPSWAVLLRSIDSHLRKASFLQEMTC